MSLNRRQLLKLLVSGVAGSTWDWDRLLWVPKRDIIYVPHPAQLRFLEAPEVTLWGVPYHQSNASMGSWLGIPRTSAYPELRALIEKLQENKNVINETAVGGTVGVSKEDRSERQITEISTNKTKHPV